MARVTETFFPLTGLQAKADSSSPSVDSKGEGYPKKCKCTKCENCGSGAEADTGTVTLRLCSDPNIKLDDGVRLIKGKI
ncbi:hypothetical protein DL771_002478 [Monosporascus sp. 5C6A]|nr:hypothetical protein DL771_002478 [Monosporascus sp. 5C6A]